VQKLFARHRLDIEPSDIAAGFAAMTATDAKGEAAEVERLWSPTGQALAAYSVRSGFHLLLTALNLPPGSEVAFSAVTHPDIPRLALHHGLVPVPVDLDRGTLAPRPDALMRAITPRTRMLVVAHLFGGLVDLDLAWELCESRGVLLVEDCAQAFRGPLDTGNPLADVSMFSFGTLKTATALGGALFTVRNASLLPRMREIQAAWPPQRPSSHLVRLARTAAFLRLTRPGAYALLARAAGRRFDHVVNSSVRAFPVSGVDELAAHLQQRPCAPLLRLLRRRLETFDYARLDARAASGERLAAMMPPGLHLGGRAIDHTHWLFPVAAPDPDRLVDAVRAAGFDAARKASSVTTVAAPSNRPDLEPIEAQEVMSRLVFLPAYPELPSGSLARIADAVASEVFDAHVAA
jgi:perosamine synthetase